MEQEIGFSVQVVHGGFILTSYANSCSRTEVYTSQGKLMKALRTKLEDNAVNQQSVTSKALDERID